MKLIVVFIVTVLATLAKARGLYRYTPNNIYVQPNRSGVHNPKIVGGEEAKIEDYPHSAALYFDDEYICGGSIIHDKFILTAAHCVDKYTEAAAVAKVKVVVGVKNLADQTAVKKEVEEVIVHDDWSSDGMKNDIALVKLKVPLDIDDDKVDMISYDRRACPNSDLDGKEGIVSGWGKISDSASSGSPVLMYVKTKIITNKECKYYYNYIDDNQHICLDGKYGKGSCNGDSGAALLSNNDQVGIVSFGNAWGCEWGFPTGYTRVACFKDWIDHKIGA